MLAKIILQKIFILKYYLVQFNTIKHYYYITKLSMVYKNLIIR